jgi:hypothetical protein
MGIKQTEARLAEADRLLQLTPIFTRCQKCGAECIRTGDKLCVLCALEVAIGQIVGTR